MVKHAIYAALLGLLVNCSPHSAVPRAEPPCSPNAQAPGEHEPYRAMVYSEAFGKRFSLPAGGVQPLDAGLQAAVIRVTQRPSQHPACYLDLYLDDTLDLAFPEGSEGRCCPEDDETPFFFIRGDTPLGAEDKRWNTMLGRLQSVACRNAPHGCVFDQSAPHAYSRHLLTGIALQTYSVQCSALDSKHGPLEMWLLRAGRDAASLDPQSLDTTGMHRFAIPTALIEHAAQRIHEAVKFFQENPLKPMPPRGQFTVPGKEAVHQ